MGSFTYTQNTQNRKVPVPSDIPEGSRKEFKVMYPELKKMYDASFVRDLFGRIVLSGQVFNQLLDKVVQGNGINVSNYFTQLNTTENCFIITGVKL